jgi:hypothetical protein
VSPRAKHIPDSAHRTTICLTDEEQAAVNWIKSARRQRGNDRKTLNDILVDGLWLLLEREEGKTREQIRTMVPHVQAIPVTQDKVTEMPKPKRKRFGRD